MKNSLLILPAAMLLAHTAVAQQQFNAPQLLNPAMTGFTPADVRASVNFTTNIPERRLYNYSIGSFAADAPVLQGKLPKGDALGVGITTSYSSLSVADNFSGNSRAIGLAAAYHKALGKKKDQYLSVGLQSSMNSGETNIRPANTYYSYMAGAMYTRSLTGNSTFYGGYTLSSIAGQPLVSHKLYAGGVWNINKRLTLNATALTGFVVNDPFRIGYTFTGMGGYTFNPDGKRPTTVYLGGSYGRGNSILPYIGIEKWGFRLAVTPYVSTSPYSSGKLKAADISLLWLGRFKKHSEKYKDVKQLPKIY